MLATGAAAITAIGGYGAYLGLSRSKDTNAPTPIDDEPEVVGKTWKESAGRTSGRDGYVFGDLSRGVIVRVFGQNEAESADAAAEASCRVEQGCCLCSAAAAPKVSAATSCAQTKHGERVSHAAAHGKHR